MQIKYLLHINNNVILCLVSKIHLTVNCKLDMNRIFFPLLICVLVMVFSDITSQFIYDIDRSKQYLFRDLLPQLDNVVKNLPLTAEEFLELVINSDIKAGEKATAACKACHSFDANSVNRTGPALWNIVNRAQSSVANFDYSDVFQNELKGNWSIQELNKFILKPKEYAYGTKMNFGGIKNDEKRAALIAYLMTLK